MCWLGSGTCLLANLKAFGFKKQVKPGPASHCPALVLCGDHIATGHCVAGTCEGAVCQIYIFLFVSPRAILFYIYKVGYFQHTAF